MRSGEMSNGWRALRRISTAVVPGPLQSGSAQTATPQRAYTGAVLSGQASAWRLGTRVPLLVLALATALGLGVGRDSAPMRPNLLAAPCSPLGPISGGGGHTLAIKPDGTVWAWGTNTNGQLGNGTTTNSSTPVEVQNINGGYLSGATAVAAGASHSLALLSDGTVWAWGLNSSGQLGINSTVNSSKAVQIQSLTSVSAIAAGRVHSLAVKSDGTVWAWGNNGSGQLGTGNTNSSLVPVQASTITGAMSVSANGYTYRNSTSPSGPLTVIVPTTADWSLALRSDGTVWSWGADPSGHTGNTPSQVAGLSGVTTISAGPAHGAVSKSDGTVWDWGYNEYGDLGNQTNTTSTTPVQAVGLTGTTEVAAGGQWAPDDLGTNHYDGFTLALKSDGTLRSWGWYGGLGDGSTANSNTPVQVNNVRQAWQVSAGALAGLAVDASGAVWSWGTNPSTVASFGAIMAPSAPTGVTASRGNAQASLSWTAPSSNGGMPIANYVVTPYIGGSAQPQIPTNSTATSYTVTGLTNGTTYTFTVAAQNCAGIGVASSPSNPITPATVPTAPQNPAATAGANSDANVTWTAPASNGGSAVTNYWVTPYEGGSPQTAVETPTAAPSFDVTGLVCGASYTFTVAAQNDVGTGPASAQTSPGVQPNCPPGAPTAPSAAAGTNSDATVSWTAPSPNGGSQVIQYLVTPYKAGVAQPSVNTGTAVTTLDVTGLTCGSSYTFTVAAQNAAGTGPASAPTSPAVEPNCPPGAPGTPTATPGNLQATVTWPAPSPNGGTPVTDYLVTPYDAGSAQTTIDTHSSATTYTVTGLTACHSYTFTVTAVNSAGQGGASSQSNAVPGPPTTPANPAATAGPSAATVRWTQSNGYGCPVSYSIQPYVGGTAQGNPRVVPQATLTSMAITALNPATGYTFQIVASDSLGTSTPATTPAITTSTPLASNRDASSQVGVFVGYADTWHGNFIPPLWPHGSASNDSRLDNGAVLLVNTGSSDVTINLVQVTIGSGYQESWPEQLPGSSFAFPPTQPVTLRAGDAETFYDPAAGLPGGDTSDVTPCGSAPSVAVTVGSQTVTYSDARYVLNTGGCDTALNEGHNWLQIGGGQSALEILNKNESEKPCFVCMGDPVNTDTGNFSHTFQDFSIPGHGVPLSFSHTYNSLDARTDSILGYGWAGSYNIFLTQDSAGNVTVHQEGGSTVTFTPPYPPPGPGQSGTYTAPGRVLASFRQNADGTFSFVRNQEQITYTFNGRGELIGETDRFGYATTLAYTNDQLVTVTDAEGRYLSFSYYATGGNAGRLHTITDSTGRAVTFNYSSSGDLQSVIDVGGGTTAFAYDPSRPHLLAQMKDPNCSADTTGTCQGINNVYDDSGRVTQQSDNVGRATRFDYSVAGQTTMTDPKGHQTIDYYSNDELTRETKGAETANPQTWAYTYDPVTLGITQITDPPQPGQTDQTLWQNQWNPSGTLAGATVTDTAATLSRTTRYTYYPNNDVNTVTDPLGVTTTYTRDPSHGYRLTQVATPYCAPANVTNCTGGNVIANRATFYSYGDTAHLDDVTQMTDPDSKVWTYAYDQYGNQTQIVDPLNEKTTYTFDALDRVQTRVSPNGYVSPNTPAQYTTTYDLYDAFGDLEHVTDPLGRTTQNVWDANRNLLQTTDGNLHTTAYHYDFANERDQVIKPDSTQAHPDVWRTTYDADGNVYQQLDGTGAATTYAYDALNHLNSSTDPLSRTTGYQYDAVGRVYKVTDAQSPPQTATYAYDPAYELTGISYSDGSTPSVGPIDYFASGLRQDMTDGTGMTTYSYDSLRRLSQSTSGAGQQVQYAYNLRNLVTSIIYPGGAQTVARAYDDAGRLHTVSDWLNHTTTFNYDADSFMVSEVYPNGITQTFTPNRDDEVTGTSGVPGLSLTYQRDNVGNVSAENTTGYGYDANNRLASVGGQSYGYDTADNMAQMASGAVQSFDAAHEVQSTTQAISLVATAAGGDIGTTNSIPLTFSAPTQANDQVLIAVTFAAVNGQNAKTPTGYTALSPVISAGAVPAETAVFRRTAGAGETGITLGFNGGSFAKSAVAVVYRGVDPVNPVDQSSSGASPVQGATSVTAPSITSALPSEQLLMFAGAAGNATATSWTPPSGMSDIVSKSDNQLTSLDISGQLLAGAGATGSRTATFGTVPSQLDGLLLALKPSRTVYTYDSRGNRNSTSSSTASATLGYDQADRLISYTSGATTATYGYNGDGLRMSRTVGGTTTQQTWDTAEAVPLMVQDGTTAYVYAAGGLPLEQVTSTGTVTYFHQDQLGSTRSLTNASGGVVGAAAYDPYGKLTTSTGMTTAFGYAGQYTDPETGFVYLRNRFYEPATAQFLTIDPAVALTREPYAYVQNDPLNATDATGLVPTQENTGYPMDDPESFGFKMEEELRAKGYDFGGDNAELDLQIQEDTLNSEADTCETRLSREERPSGARIGSKAPEYSSPYDVRVRYDDKGNVTYTTYDRFGRRVYQYEFGNRVRHGEGYHMFDPLTGERSGHIGL